MRWAGVFISLALFIASFFLPAVYDPSNADPLLGYHSFVITWLVFPTGWIAGLANFMYLLAFGGRVARRIAFAKVMAVIAVVSALFGLFNIFLISALPNVGYFCWIGSMVVLSIEAFLCRTEHYSHVAQHGHF